MSDHSFTVPPIAGHIKVGDHRFVYIRYSSTLTQALPLPYADYLYRNSNDRINVWVPIYTLYDTQVTWHSTIIANIKVVAEDELPSAGLYYAYADPDYDYGSYAGYKMPQYVVDSERRYYPDIDISDFLGLLPRVSVYVSSVNEQANSFTFTNLEGIETTIHQLPGFGVGRIIEGPHIFTRIAIAVPIQPDGVKPDKIYHGWLVYAKAGRGDWHRSGTSHQANIVIVDLDTAHDPD